MKTRLVGMVAATTLLLGACLDPLEPGAADLGGAAPTVELATRFVHSTPLPAYEAKGDGRRILVTGAIRTPVWCYDLAATVARERRQITLSITAVPQGTLCTLVPATFAYEAVIQGLTRGSYEIRIVHSYPPDSFVVFEESATVPF